MPQALIDCVCNTDTPFLHCEAQIQQTFEAEFAGGYRLLLVRLLSRHLAAACSSTSRKTSSRK
jgi:hypothetical protein